MSKLPNTTPPRAPLPRLSNKAVALLWAEFYQGTGDREKMSRAYEVIMSEYFIPWAGVNAIGWASSIHGGDMGIPYCIVSQLLKETGAIESLYTTRRQMGGGPARSFWQIEPETAHDLLENSKPLCGMRWQERFGRRERHRLVRMKLHDLSVELETRDDLAASIAAMKWIASAHKAIKQTLKQQEEARTLAP